MKTFTGRRVLITGGAQGLGLSLAHEFARQGAELILCDLKLDSLEKAAAQLGASGTKVSIHVADVTDPAAIERLREAVHAQGGPIDVLVNNAGVVFGGRFLDVPVEKHHATYRVNTLGVVSMTHAFLPDLIARPDSRLLNIASASALVGLPYASTYASSKWAVLGLSESIRLELAQLGHHHVRVTAACPSFISTGMFDGASVPRLTRPLTPQQIATKIVRACHRGDPVLLEPFMAKLVPALSLLPAPLFDALGRVFKVTSSMEQWKGHTPGRSD